MGNLFLDQPCWYIASTRDDHRTMRDPNIGNVLSFIAGYCALVAIAVSSQALGDATVN